MGQKKKSNGLKLAVAWIKECLKYNPQKEVFESKKWMGLQKMKMKCFSQKKGLSNILPKIKYDISEPHGDLLHWNLSWASTFNTLFT